MPTLQKVSADLKLKKPKTEKLQKYFKQVRAHVSLEEYKKSEGPKKI